MAEKLDLNFSNISMPFFAEGFINFGFFGIILFVLFLAKYSAKFDALYWKFIVYERQNFFRIFYFIMLGMLFFVLRGDLMSSFAYSLGFLLSAFSVFKLVNRS